MSYSYRLELTRTGLAANKSIEGHLFVYRGAELLGEFSTMERGNGYVYLRVGSYPMKHSRKGTGRKVKCLCPIEERVSTILIHDAKSRRPTSLAGCIAPFFMGSEAYEFSSAEAMESLWEMIGGYERGKRDVTLEVLTNVGTDTLTKETWKWDHRKQRR